MFDTKIIIVVAVLSVILLGIGVYLFLMDRKIKKMEDYVKEDKKK